MPQTLNIPPPPDGSGIQTSNKIPPPPDGSGIAGQTQASAVHVPAKENNYSWTPDVAQAKDQLNKILRIYSYYAI